MTAKPILETRGLTCRFGGVTAVDNVDFAIAEGELRCLIGPNGAGKSTLFRCMTRPASDQGRDPARDRSLAGYHPHQIARMGVAIKNQIPSVYGGLSVRENIWLAGATRPSRQELGQAVEAVLEDEVRRSVALCSVGWTGCPTNIGSGLNSACSWRPAQRWHCSMSLRRE